MSESKDESQMGEVVELFKPEETQSESESEVTTTDEQESKPPDYEQMAMQTAMAIRDIYQSGDQVAYIVANPAIKEELEAALKALPEEALPKAFTENLPIEQHEKVQGIQIVTGEQIEMQYLQKYLEQNGTLSRLQQFLSQQPVRVQVTADVLRMIYFQDVLQKIGPRIERPPLGSDVLQVIRGRN